MRPFGMISGVLFPLGHAMRRLNEIRTKRLDNGRRATASGRHRWKMIRRPVFACDIWEEFAGDNDGRKKIKQRNAFRCGFCGFAEQL